MFRILCFTLACLAATFLVVGCSSDTPTTPDATIGALKTVIAGEIESGATAFAYSAAAPGDPSPGSFRIQGSNLRYETDPDMLLADVVLVNDSTADFPGPARLVFMQLLPRDVTVMNADNADTAIGAGAMFAFAFADTDSVWRAGAATEPRTIQFDVAPGASIGFVSRILVGDEPVGGSIGGLVWHDMNHDGLVDEGETGVRDIGLVLHSGSETNAKSAMMETRTDVDGRYHFAALPSGHYTVALAADERIVPTTSPVMEVLLIEHEGEVMDFMDADFGVARAAVPPDTTACIEVGDCVNAKGLYLDEPNRLETGILNVCDRSYDCEEDDDGDDDGDCEDCGDDKSRDGMCWGRLSGPITDIDRENHAIAVMGTWIHLTADDLAKHDRDGEIGMDLRVRVNVEVVAGDDGDRLVACRIHKWNGNGDRVRGYVQEVVRNDDGLVGVRVLNTLVTIPAGFQCDDDDQEDDDS
jgi:SdrD B-like domain